MNENDRKANETEIKEKFENSVEAENNLITESVQEKVDKEFNFPIHKKLLARMVPKPDYLKLRNQYKTQPAPNKRAKTEFKQSFEEIENLIDLKIHIEIQKHKQ